MELKPCPFCGQPPILNHVVWDGDKYYVECNGSCGAEISTGLHEKEIAIGIWNTRPIEDELRERIAELEKALWRCQHERISKL